MDDILGKGAVERVVDDVERLFRDDGSSLLCAVDQLENAEGGPVLLVDEPVKEVLVGGAVGAEHKELVDVAMGVQHRRGRERPRRLGLERGAHLLRGHGLPFVVPGETSLLALGVSFANHARQRLDQLREERLLVFEMLVERPGGHAGSLADPAQVRLLEPLFQKRRKAALQDALVRLLVVAVAHCSHLPPIIT